MNREFKEYHDMVFYLNEIYRWVLVNKFFSSILMKTFFFFLKMFEIECSFCYASSIVINISMHNICTWNIYRMHLNHSNKSIATYALKELHDFWAIIICVTNETRWKWKCFVNRSHRIVYNMNFAIRWGRREK